MKIHHKKRQGHHQRRSKKFSNVYLPYLPMAGLLTLSLIFSGILPDRGNTLAYATNLSTSGLLQSTNGHRSNHGRAKLSINQALNSAAQAKANDMVNRDYWSHNTPDGQEPWIFIQNAGYKYQKAGENLAYGFLTSNDTVAGWMNSPTHKQNMLDRDFTEVGFGFANSTNFNDSGQQTVVVAMYAKPQVLASSQPVQQPSSEPVKTASQPTQQKEAPEATNQPKREPVNEPEDPEPENLKEDDDDILIVSDSEKSSAPIGDTSAIEVAKVGTLTGGYAPWATLALGIVSGVAVTILLIKHAVGFKRLIHESEEFVLHHPIIDGTAVGIIVLALVLSRTAGFIL
jgi:uncharacterized protein YkwD